MKGLAIVIATVGGIWLFLFGFLKMCSSIDDMQDQRIAKEVEAWKGSPKVTVLVPTQATWYNHPKVRLLCLDGLQYYWIAGHDISGLAPKLTVDGKPIACFNEIEGKENGNI